MKNHSLTKENRVDINGFVGCYLLKPTIVEYLPSNQNEFFDYTANIQFKAEILCTICGIYHDKHTN